MNTSDNSEYNPCETCSSKDSCDSCWFNNYYERFWDDKNTNSKSEQTRDTFKDKVKRVTETYWFYRDKYREYREQKEKKSFIPRILRFKKNKEIFILELKEFYENLKSLNSVHWIKQSNSWLINLAKMWIWSTIMWKSFPNPFAWAAWLVLIVNWVSKTMSIKKAKHELIEKENSLNEKRKKILKERDDLEDLYYRISDDDIDYLEIEKEINIERLLGIYLTGEEKVEEFY